MSNTIAAISTAPGIGGIGIIRISGDECFYVLEKIFKQKNPQKIEEIKGYTIKFGNIIDENKNIIDEVLVSYFKAPKSYTTENMCEINSHGGVVIMNKILDLCIKNGAEIAEPGEFTKRAFLNGRMDLSQAEAVIDVINAKTDKEAKISLEQLEGNLSQKITKIRKIIISIMADIEATIDYPEYDLEEVTNVRILNTLNEVEKLLISLENSFYNGKILREGIKVAIIGRPNAGKSSLLNVILNEEDKKILDLLKDKNAIILLNKIDLKVSIDTNIFEKMDKPIINISTKTKEGIDELYNEISKMFKLKEIANDGETIVSNVRHKNIIINSRKNLLKAKETIENNLPIDIISTYLKEIIEELGKITGETVTEDVIAEIFSKFCLGK